MKRLLVKNTHPKRTYIKAGYTFPPQMKEFLEVEVETRDAFSIKSVWFLKTKEAETQKEKPEADNLEKVQKDKKEVELSITNFDKQVFLEGKNLDELRDIAKEKKITGISTLRKGELIEKLIDHI